MRWRNEKKLVLNQLLLFYFLQLSTRVSPVCVPTAERATRFLQALSVSACPAGRVRPALTVSHCCSFISVCVLSTLYLRLRHQRYIMSM